MILSVWRDVSKLHWRWQDIYVVECRLSENLQHILWPLASYDFWLQCDVSLWQVGTGHWSHSQLLKTFSIFSIVLCVLLICLLCVWKCMSSALRIEHAHYLSSVIIRMTAMYCPWKKFAVVTIAKCLVHVAFCRHTLYTIDLLFYCKHACVPCFWFLCVHVGCSKGWETCWLCYCWICRWCYCWSNLQIVGKFDNRRSAGWAGDVCTRTYCSRGFQ